MYQEIILDAFQEEAIRFARAGDSVIVSAPTGSGKTLIAEHIINDCITEHKGVIYTAPIKALSNQKFRDFSRSYPRKTGILTGDVSINPRAPVLIMTTEIFRNSILTEPARFRDREWVIFDEIHYLDDIERGTVWEETIILLPPHMRMLALSATLPNIDEFVDWLNAVHSFTVRKVVENNRPVPLHFYYQCNNRIVKNFSQLKHEFKNTYEAGEDYKKRFKPNRLYSLITHLKEGDALSAIYFCFSRRRCEDLASELYGFHFLTKDQERLIVGTYTELLEKFDIQNNPGANDLAELIRRGIAYHHAGLLPSLKEVIERLFTSGLIKLIFTTETFALGVNMPAKTVCFDNLYKFYGRSHHYLKTRDLYQMAGRAGRRGIDTEGFVFLRVNPQRLDGGALKRMLFGEYEAISSQLRSCYATVLNLYTIMGQRLYDIYPKSFHFLQSNTHQKKEALGLLRRKIAFLKNQHYILDEGLSQKAQLAAKVYSFELHVGELFDIGYFQALDEVTLFMVACALVYEPRKGEHMPHLSKRARKIKKELRTLVKAIHRGERRFRIYPLSKKFYFNLVESARAWCEGTQFVKLYRYTSVDEGEIVRYFRMAIQVLREMRASKMFDEELLGRIDTCLSRVNRDVVDAERQLRQEL